MSQQHPWGPSRQQQRSGLTPISTAFAQEHAPSSSSGARQGFSPASNNFPSLPSLPSSTVRHVGSRTSSAASSTSSPFSPAYAGQQPPASQLLSSRTRTIAPHAASQQASSTAALPTVSQPGGAISTSGGGGLRLNRDSPSLSTSSTVGSPSTSANPASAASSQNLSRIVIAQVFLLLSQFGPLKDEKDRTKWDTQTEQIRKVSARRDPLYLKVDIADDRVAD
jgi:CCR4-NOT transcription complex subunit 1